MAAHLPEEAVDPGEVADRRARGGVGVTIGVSIVVFGLYYVCLMGGETLGVASWEGSGKCEGGLLF